jgi:predicted nuclease of predicted toxin-antitoxin system
MILVADEGVDRQIVDRLRSDGHEVYYVAEMEPGISDLAVLDIAAKHGAVLVTSDKDFGELSYRQGRSASGIILLRLAELNPDARAALVSDAVSGHEAELADAFTVISPGVLRIRRRREQDGVV